MMWQSKKALDVRDPGAREAYCVEVERRVNWRPMGDFHLSSRSTSKRSATSARTRGSTT
jgi:hypothetical protein